MPNSGLFLCFEGGEGTGKTTQIKILKEKLESLGRQVTLTWEPGGTPLGQKIRELLLDNTLDPMSARCEALLYAAARAEHVDKIILPALNKGHAVLCDRYWDASRAYQGIARGLGLRPIDRVNEWGTLGIYPDWTFVFDLPAAKGLARAEARGVGLDRIESEGLSFHDKVRDAYLYLAQSQPATHSVIDASQAVQELSEIVWNKVKTLNSFAPNS
jgi:dTMP kinase